MEKVLQYFDELDDLVGAVGLVAEKLRHVLWAVVLISIGGFAEYGAILVALLEPPLALAIAVMLFVILLYRSVTRPMIVERRDT